MNTPTPPTQRKTPSERKQEAALNRQSLSEADLIGVIEALTGEHPIPDKRNGSRHRREVRR
ncbi:hypothetical protein RW1_038_00600 [Rhodococcus wratislaviensis NBRC 100605]|uniref:Uncharacterized protein n=1 Tax=Rhodococcus wratislaviensis NBRC 100605 TaxID=1219028 RepID=X0PV68_RHOWR|nr:hypothetical protein RW1_038_00600 [Rhodococcus wratislaviensis NBRC 100605]